MKKVIDYLFGWLKESNRMAHLKVGCIITAVMFIMCAVYNVYVFYLLDRAMRADFVVTSLLFASAVSLACTTIAMMSVEYIQKNMGGEWDNKDVAAGILMPACMSVLTFIVFLAVV